MLNRAVSSPTWTPNRAGSWRSALSRPDTAILLRYVLVVAVLCVLGCLYLWQVNAISDITNDTLSLKRQTRDLEARNSSLMQQLARWESPAYIDRRSNELGMAPAGAALHVKVPAVGNAAAAANLTPAVLRVAEAATGAGETR